MITPSLQWITEQFVPSYRQRKIFRAVAFAACLSMGTVANSWAGQSSAGSENSSEPISLHCELTYSKPYEEDVGPFSTLIKIHSDRVEFDIVMSPFPNTVPITSMTEKTIFFNIVDDEVTGSLDRYTGDFAMHKGLGTKRWTNGSRGICRHKEPLF